MLHDIAKRFSFAQTYKVALNMKCEQDSWKSNLGKVNQDLESHLNVGLVSHAALVKNCE